MNRRIKHKIKHRILAATQVPLQQGQPVAVYWGTLDNGIHYYYAGELTDVSDDEVTFLLNDGTEEIIPANEFKSIIPLMAKSRIKGVLTKQQVANLRVGSTNNVNEVEKIARTIAQSISDEMTRKHGEEDPYWTAVVNEPLSNDTVTRVAKAMLAGKVHTLMDYIGNQPNDMNLGTQRGFERVSGLKIVGKNRAKKRQAIFDYLGYSEEQINQFLAEEEKFKAEKAAKIAEAKRQREIEAIEEAADYNKIDVNGETMTYRQFIDDVISKGFTDVKKTRQTVKQSGWTIGNPTTGRYYRLNIALVPYAQLAVSRL